MGRVTKTVKDNQVCEDICDLVICQWEEWKGGDLTRQICSFEFRTSFRDNHAAGGTGHGKEAGRLGHLTHMDNEWYGGCISMRPTDKAD